MSVNFTLGGAMRPQQQQDIAGWNFYRRPAHSQTLLSLA